MKWSRVVQVLEEAHEAVPWNELVRVPELEEFYLDLGRYAESLVYVEELLVDRDPRDGKLYLSAIRWGKNNEPPMAARYPLCVDKKNPDQSHIGPVRFVAMSGEASMKMAVEFGKVAPEGEFRWR